MEKTMPIVKLACVVIFISSIFSAKSYTIETWKITSLDWQPYSGSDMKNQGHSVQKLRELLSKKGITLAVEFYPWKRAQYLAKNKEYVGYFPAWPEEVAKGFVGSEAVDWSEVQGLKRSGEAISYGSTDELFKKYRIGIVRTYVYPKVITDAMKKYSKNVVKSNDEKTLLKMLSAGRFDIGITDPKVMMYLAKKEGIFNVEPLDKTIVKKKLVVAFRNDDENKNRINLLTKLLK